MKRIALKLFVAGLFVGLSGLAQAQMVGLPIMDTASPRAAGKPELTPGVVFGEDMNFYGGRALYTVKDDLRVFLDVGQVSVTDGDANIGVQGGGLYALPKNELMDLGIRGAFYTANTDTLGLNGVDVMVVFSNDTSVEHLCYYGGVGLDAVYKSTETAQKKDDDKGEINPALSLGLAYQMNAHFSAYTEASYIDGMYFGIGICIR
jgi:hypothetical protein